MEFCISESLFLVGDVIMLVQSIDGNHSEHVPAQLSRMMTSPADTLVTWHCFGGSMSIMGGSFCPLSHNWPVNWAVVQMPSPLARATGCRSEPVSHPVAGRAGLTGSEREQQVVRWGVWITSQAQQSCLSLEISWKFWSEHPALCQFCFVWAPWWEPQMFQC